MGYLTLFCLFYYLIIKPCEVSSITTRVDHQRVRNFRRHIDTPQFTDWELGLRESVHQALLREHYTEPTLREQLLEAPFLGRQNHASPFGDIAVLARGQLYVTAEGFKFLQDSDQDECNDCHNPRCAESPQCHLWKSLGHHHKLLALWTVKRIRHRDPQYGHVFELEYTISPITSEINEELVRRHGYINYNVPGHIFVIRSNPRASSTNYLSGDKWYKNQPVEQNEDHKETGSGHFKPGILIGVGPDGFKHVLHSFPGFYSSYHPQNQYNDHTTIDPKEYELYKKLIESLASKTSNVPHRFSPTDKTTVKPTYVTTLVPQTTFIQTTDGHLVPLTQNTLAPTTIKFPSTKVTKYSEPDLFYQTTTQVPTPQPPKPITMPVTTVHYYTPVDIPTSPKVTATTSKPTRKTTVPDFDIFTTEYNTIPITTEQFEVRPVTATTPKPTKKTTLPDFDVFTTRYNKVTVPITTQAEQFEVRPLTSTEPMHPVTEVPIRTSPKGTNEQLPPPDRKETTVPYGSSTVTQPSITEKFTPRHETTTVIEKVPYTEQRTTILVPVSTTEEQRSTTGGTTLYTVTAANPTTIHQRQQSTTGGTTLYTVTAPNPTTIRQGQQSTTGGTILYTVPAPNPTTIREVQQSTTSGSTTIRQPTITTGRVPSVYESTTPVFTVFASKPTTLFGYTFDTSTKAGTTTNTLVPTTNHLPSTQIVKFPTTTSVYYFESEPTITEGTTLPQSTQSNLPTTVVETTPARVTALSTVKTTRKRVPIASSTTDDFLVVSDNEKPPKITDSKKDFDEDDIFGTAAVKTTTELPQMTTKRVIQSDISKALFGGRRSKQIKHSSKVTKRPVSNTTKIIYNNFYSPGRKRTIVSTTTGPSTEQSYSTSISFEINKRDGTKSQVEPTVRADVQETELTDYKIYKGVSSTTEKTRETKKAFDDIALQLVNHARSIDYLNRKTTRQPKYRRRSFTARRKSLRRVNVDDEKKKDTV